MARMITRQRRLAFRAAVAAEDRGEVGAVAAAEGPREGFFRVRLGSFEVNITISQHIFLIYSVCLSSYLIRISNNLFSSNRIFLVSNLHFQFQLGPDIFESPEDNGASGGRTEQDNQDNNAGGTAELNLEV